MVAGEIHPPVAFEHGGVRRFPAVGRPAGPAATGPRYPMPGQEAGLEVLGILGMEGRPLGERELFTFGVRLGAGHSGFGANLVVPTSMPFFVR